MQSGIGQLKQSLIGLMGLIAALAFGGGGAQASDRLQLLSKLTWSEPQDWFGGFSGMEVSADGNTLTLITDRGSLVTARITRKDGQLSAVTSLTRIPLLNQNKTPLVGSFRDAEGLAIGRDGQSYLSFEFRHRVTRLDQATGVTTRLPGHRDFPTFGGNAGLEALAVHPDGRLFALVEAASPNTGTIPLYRFANGRWQLAQHLPSDGRFLPVGAEFDQLGQLYVLERRLTPLGFQSRIRRFDLTPPLPTTQTLLTTNAGAYDNLEALTLWTDSTGGHRLIVISDDNFLSLQRTQVIEFAITD